MSVRPNCLTQRERSVRTVQQRQTDRQRQIHRQTDRQTDTEAERQTERERRGEREREGGVGGERENLKTLFFKDCSLASLRPV